MRPALFRVGVAVVLPLCTVLWLAPADARLWQLVLLAVLAGFMAWRLASITRRTTPSTGSTLRFRGKRFALGLVLLVLGAGAYLGGREFLLSPDTGLYQVTTKGRASGAVLSQHIESGAERDRSTGNLTTAAGIALLFFGGFAVAYGWQRS